MGLLPALQPLACAGKGRVMSPLSMMVWLVFAVSLLPGALVAIFVSLIEPQVGVWAGVFVFGFTFTSILDWLVAPKSGGK